MGWVIQDADVAVRGLTAFGRRAAFVGPRGGLLRARCGLQPRLRLFERSASEPPKGGLSALP